MGYALGSFASAQLNHDCLDESMLMVISSTSLGTLVLVPNTKTHHEHHIYVLVHVMECIDEALLLKRSVKVLNKKLLHHSYN